MTAENGTIFQELGEYFQNEADGLIVEANRAGIFSNKADLGTAREDILLKFLSRHMPKRCDIIKGGFLFSANGIKSRQIDLIVTNDLTMQFKQFDNEKLAKSFNWVEGCYCAISVKTFLDKDSLIDSLENLESIPTITRNIINNPWMTNWKELQDQIPQRVIFAYRGIDSSTILNHLRSYYSEKKVATQLRPDLIIVLNSYNIFKAGIKGVNVLDGTYIAPGTYGCLSDRSYVGSTSLIQLLSRIQAVSIMGSWLNFDLEEFFKGVDKAFMMNKSA
jgi:hypothetical protein